MLPEKEAEIRTLFRSHNEPKDGYKVRRVCMYGISECIRADLAGAMLKEGDIQGFGRLISLHHDGDRVTRLVKGDMVPVVKDYADARMDQLIAAAEKPGAPRETCVWAQSGGYDVSVPEIDMLVDLAIQVEGVAGAGLVGAGLGGSMAVLVKAENAETVVRHLAKNYYEPKGLPVKAEIVSAVSGAGVLPL